MTAAGHGGRARAANTMRALVARPGAIAHAALEGQGREYLPLGGLFTTFVVLFFLLTWIQHRRPVAPSPDVAAACGAGADQSAVAVLLGTPGGAGHGAMSGGSPAADEALGMAGHLLCNPGEFTYAFSLAVPLGFILLMPVSAGLMQLAFRKERPSYRANWTYGVEAHSALFLLLSVLAAIGLVGSFWLGFAASVAGLFYTSWNVIAGVQRAYGVDARTATWRTTAVGAVYAVLLAVLAVAIMWVLLSRN